MKKIIKNTLILTIITVVAGLCLGLVYEITKKPIADSQEKAKKGSMAGCIPGMQILSEFKQIDVDAGYRRSGDQ